MNVSALLMRLIVGESSELVFKYIRRIFITLYGFKVSSESFTLGNPPLRLELEVQETLQGLEGFRMVQNNKKCLTGGSFKTLTTM